MDKNSQGRLFRILDSLPQPANPGTEQTLSGLASSQALDKRIPPGSVFEDRLPIGGQPTGLFWCPDGIPATRLTTLLSSRLGQRAFEKTGVVRAVRSFFATRDNGSLLATADGITLDSALRRGSQLLGIPLLRFLPFPAKFDERIAQELQTTSRDADEFRVYAECTAYSGFDQLLIKTCNQTRLVSVRNNGTLHSALCDHAASMVSESSNDALILCLVDRDLTSPGLHDELRQLGCQDWWLYPGMEPVDNDTTQQTNVGSRGKTSGTDGATEQLATLVTMADIRGEFLSHWTRPVQNSWPDRNALSQWDSIWFGEQTPCGAAGTLLRILAQQTILANGSLIRGGQPMCCFTEVPPVEFARRRVFRSHLSRWDFEPFGISIRRSALESLGGRRVRYATRNECESADKATQAWLVSSESRADWSREQEWRVEGNVDLRLLAIDDVFVFVPDPETACVIRPFSRWPITVIG